MTERPRKNGKRLGLTALLGVLTVPAAAIVAVALLHEPQQDVEVAGAPSTTLPTVVEASAPTTDFVIEPVTSTDDDLIAACTTDGLLLVELEESETLTELQAAALAALRQLCEEAGIPLPGPPAPPPVVRTVKVSKPADPEGSGGGGGEGSGGGSEPTDASAEYAAALADAKAAIATAESQNPESEDLREAREKLAEAERKAARGEYREAIAKAREAEHEAKEALHGDD